MSPIIDTRSDKIRPIRISSRWVVAIASVIVMLALAWWFRYSVTVVRADRSQAVLLVHDRWTNEIRIELRVW